MKVFSKKLLSTLVGLLFISGIAAAADPAVETLLSHMRDAYSQVKGARYSTTSTLTQTDGPKQDVEQSFVYKKPNMIRAIVKVPKMTGALTIITDGKTINVTTPQGSAPEQPFSVDVFVKALPGNLETISFFDYERQLSTAAGKNMETSTFHLVKDEEWDNKHWIVLEESATKDNVLCRYFIDPKTFFIWRTQVSDLKTHQEQIDSKLTSLDANATIDDSIFTGN
jgi:outer membrane lipoprotein-sorting protein